MRRSIRECVVLSSCIVWIGIAGGCGRHAPAQVGDVEALRQRAQETGRNPPTESEDRAIASLWASMSEMAPPPNFMGRDPLDKGVAEQNRLFVAAEIAQAVEEVGLDKQIPLMLIRGKADVVVHHT